MCVRVSVVFFFVRFHFQLFTYYIFRLILNVSLGCLYSNCSYWSYKCFVFTRIIWQINRFVKYIPSKNKVCIIYVRFLFTLPNLTKLW